MADTVSLIDSFTEAVRSTTAIEWAGLVTALVYVVLAAKENVLCWPFGVASSAIYTWFNFHLKLPLDGWLNVYYCAVGLYGWYAWVRGKQAQKDGAVLHRASGLALLFSLLAGAAAVPLLGYLSHRFTQSPLPYFDAALTSFSLVATWMTARKMLENWLVWVVVDAAYIVIYFMRSAPMTAALFFIYTIIAAYGYFEWRKRIRTSNA